MLLRIARQEIELVKVSTDHLILGMVTADGRVHLKVADHQTCPGHREWAADVKGVKVIGGFSLLVKSGRVIGVFPLSTLNPTEDAKLPQAWLSQILRKLPTDPTLRAYD